MTLKTFNEIRDEQHRISRARDYLVKRELQENDNNGRKHSFLYGYNQGTKEYGNGRLVGKKEDILLIENSSKNKLSDCLHQEQNILVLTKKLTLPKK